MTAAGALVLASLDALGHEDVLAAAATHSSQRVVRAEASLLLGLGGRRLSVFAAMHDGALRELAGRRGTDPEVRAARGRALSLLEKTKEARLELSSAIRAGSARAGSWLAETYVRDEPARALSLLDAARRRGDDSPASACRRARALLFLDRPARALAALEASAPGLYVREVLRVLALDALGRRTQARAAAAAAAAADRGCPFGFAAQGRLAAAEGDLEAATGFYHRARDLDLDVGGEYMFEIFGVRLAWEAPERYLARLDAHLRLHPDSAVFLAERAELLRHPKFCRYEEALRDYAAAVRFAPGRGWLVALLARALNLAGGGRAGLEEFDRAAELAPDSGWILAWRGAAMARVGESARALADFDAAVARMPWYSFAYAWRGALLRRLGRAPEATADLDAALHLDPTYAFSWNERFQARLESGDPDGAADDLKTAFSMDPKFTWEAVRGKRAGAELDAALKSRPKSAWLKVWRGHARLSAGRPAEAVKDLRAAARLLPREALVWAWLGRALTAAGKRAEAARGLSRAAKLDAKSWSVLKALADLHAAAGEWKKALPHLRRAAELAPTTVSLLMDHASAAARLGREDEALKSLHKAMELDPRYAEARASTAKIHLARAARRQEAGDFAGQAEDFRAALAAAPELFPPAERERLKALLDETDGGKS